MNESNEQGFEQYFPSAADIAAVFSDDSEWEVCEGCGEDYPAGAFCDCGYEPEPSDDFPLADEYDGPFGLPWGGEDYSYSMDRYEW